MVHAPSLPHMGVAAYFVWAYPPMGGRTPQRDVRDGMFDEDRSQVLCDNIPQMMAALRNTAIGLLRWAGHTNIAAGCRPVARPPPPRLGPLRHSFEKHNER